jgi:hypothetical protein
MPKRKRKTMFETFYGAEPELGEVVPELYGNVLREALNYYKSVPLADKRKWFDSWAVSAGFDKAGIKRIPTTYLSTISGVARMIERGFPLIKEDLDKIHTRTVELIEKFTHSPTVNNEEENLINANKKLRHENEIAGLLGELDRIIDRCVVTNKKMKVEVLGTYDLNKGDYADLIKGYKSERKDWVEILAARKSPDNDRELVESYNFMTMAGVKKVIELLDDIIMYLSGNMPIPKARKPRAKKVITNVKKVSKMKFKETDSAIGISSIEPERIIGSNTLYVFNTKTRKLARYRSTDGFEVKGTTLKNFDDGSTHKTIRKPEEIIRTLMGSNKIPSSKLYDGIRAVAGKATGRINKDCVLLKVY